MNFLIKIIIKGLLMLSAFYAAFFMLHYFECNYPFDWWVLPTQAIIVLVTLFLISGIGIFKK